MMYFKKLLFLLLLVISYLVATVPPNIIYQGYLTQSETPANGLKSFSFYIKSGGSTVWQLMNTNIEVTDGAYTAVLPVSKEDLHPSNDYSLQIWAGGVQLNPDVDLRSVPYAYYASSLDGIVNINNGNVGIGTTNPEEKLHIYGNGAQMIRLESTDNNPVLRLYGSDTRFAIYTYNSGGNLVFQCDSHGNKKVVINSNGHVGIDTTTPLAPLHVQGTGGVE
ncbi:hypothetical protein ACFL6D_03040, partial [Spirochaetota bacterium]